jgi:hypothetical protein
MVFHLSEKPYSLELDAERFVENSDVFPTTTLLIAYPAPEPTALSPKYMHY